MKKTNHVKVKFLMTCWVIFVFTFSFELNAAEISRDARKHMIRGQAAMEEAKDVADYQDAVAEFKKAIEYVPEWADAWFNLGVAQEETGGYADAIESFSKYLKLNPNAADSTKVEDRIFKLEYRQEKAQRTKREEEHKQEEAQKREKRSVDDRYIDNGDGTITDTRTNLMWAKKDSYADLGKGLDWNDSRSYVSRLNTGGYSDWRMPSVRELQGIYEKSKRLMAYNNNSSMPLHLDTIFAEGGAYGYWSSETAGPSFARTFGFWAGRVYESGRKRPIGSGVRAVRR